MRHPAYGLVAALVVVLAGCSGPHDVVEPPADDAASAAHEGWVRISADELDEAQKAQQQRALDAVQAMGGRLMGELTTALDERGPDGAIEVCSIRAPEIGAAVSNEYGLVLGRTSFRLRNPSNMPPEWAEALVREQVAEPTWLVGPGGQLGGMLPIRLKAECGMCHGPREQIADDVLATLDRLYPQDVATGFAEGDLRGWFWVEAPASS